MIRSDRRIWPLATGLALVAGYVDAIGFQHLGGYFVSFMSGNGTMLAVRLASPQARTGTVILAGLLALFIAGVVIGTLIRLALPRAGQAAVLAFVAVLLGGFALWVAGPRPRWWWRWGRSTPHSSGTGGEHRRHLYDRHVGQDRAASGAYGRGAAALGLGPLSHPLGRLSGRGRAGRLGVPALGDARAARGLGGGIRGGGGRVAVASGGLTH